MILKFYDSRVICFYLYHSSSANTNYLLLLELEFTYLIAIICEMYSGICKLKNMFLKSIYFRWLKMYAFNKQNIESNYYFLPKHINHGIFSS